MSVSARSVTAPDGGGDRRAEPGRAPGRAEPVGLRESVLRTKFAVPQGPSAMVSRPRLLDLLDAGVEGTLTLVAAPAGAGKSALLSSWIREGGPRWPLAWVSLDADDTDRRRFWRAVLEALARATDDERIGAIVPSPREPMSITTLLAALADALGSHEEPVVLVLDDLHHVAESVQADLKRLVRFPPPALRLIVLTRVDPSLGLPRLRLDGSVTEIRADELAFTLAEARSLLGSLGIELSNEDLEAVWRRTEGWAAGLRLAAMSLRHHDDPSDFIAHFAGTDATVSDYLVSEVLAHEPPDVRDFLLRTSIVDVISAELADTLTGESSGFEMLANLEHGGALMAPLDEHGTSHRYHPLFAELLRAELRSQLPDEVPELHRRAATWFAAHGNDAAALRHAIEGTAWDLAADLATQRWMSLLFNGEISALRPLLEHMPGERVEADPELALALGGALLAGGQPGAAESYLEIAVAQATRVPAASRAHFDVSRAALRLYGSRLRGDLSESLACARVLLDRELESLDCHPDFRAFVLTQLGVVELWTGDLGPATEHLERAYASSNDGGSEWTALVSAAHLAVARALRGEIARALRRAGDAVALAERRGWTRTEPVAAAYSVQAAVCLQRGQAEQAGVLIEKASDALDPGRERPLQAIHALNRVFLLSDYGEFDLALSVLHAARDDLGDWPLLALVDGILTAQEGLLRVAVGDRDGGRRLLEGAAHGRPAPLPVANALARLQLWDDEPAAARETLAPHLRGDAANDGLVGPVSARTEAWVIDALACDALADHDEAARSLERSLDLADPNGFKRPIIAHGDRIRPLLQRQIRRGTAHPAMIYEALEVTDRSSARRPQRPFEPLAVGLSEREQAILRYLPTLMSNQEIGGELFVSVNTVKTHLKAIYRKLDASDRRTAVQRARQLGLLP